MAFARIVQDVREYFVERGVAASVDVGWKARARQTNIDASGCRVVFTPVSPLTPTAGVTHPGRGPEQPARQLLNLLFAYEISILGYDPDEGGQNDLFHIGKCIDLYEAIVQAVWRRHDGTVTWGAGRWTDTVKDVRRGAELVVPFTINLPLYDAAETYHQPKPVPVKGPAGMTDPEEETDEP